MRVDAICRIEDWFAANNFDGAFHRSADDAPRITNLSSRAAHVIYTTKWASLGAAVARSGKPERFALISCCGLPFGEHLEEVRARLGGRKLHFFGDLDPPALMIFAWLRECLGADLTHAAINDRFLIALDRPIPASYCINLEPSERQAFALMPAFLPDLSNVVGPTCHALLASGRKIELEAAVSSQRSAEFVLRAAFADAAA